MAAGRYPGAVVAVTDALHYGALAPDDAPALRELLGRAFGVTTAECEPWFDLAGRDNIRVVRRGAVVEGGCMVLPMGQYFGGVRVPTGAIAGVGVRTDARRGGVATRMMTEALLELHARGTPLSTLYASNAELYRRVGYEAAGARFAATVRPRELPFHERGGSSRDLAGADDAAVHGLYDAVARHRNGHMARSEYLWHRLHRVRHGIAAQGLLLHDDDGAPEAYLFWRLHRREMFHRLEVTDWVALTPRGHRRLWSTIVDLRTMIEDVRFYTAPADPMLRVLPDPRLEVHLEAAWMLRIVDVAKAIGARGYRSSLRCALGLQVRDDVIAANDGTFTVEFADGRASVSSGGKPELQLDVRTLASIYSGFVDVRTAVALGQLQGEPDALDRLALAFGDGAPWMPEMF